MSQASGTPPSGPSVRVAPLVPAHRGPWDPLARAYKAFYQAAPPPSDYDAAWHRLMAGDPVFGLGAWLDGHLVGIAHAMFQPSAWTDRVCYLQDLYVDEAARGHGAARALIAAVAERARAAGAGRYYWLTRQDNITARRLYDQVAQWNGFLRYEYPIDAPA